MTENLIKRYLLEKAYEEGKEKEIAIIGDNMYQDKMFNLFKQGKIEISELKFSLWLKNLKSRKMLFGSYLKECGYLAHQNRIIEVTEDENICTTSGLFLKGKKEKIIEPVGDCYCTHPNPLNLKGHLVINGVYANQLIYLARSCSNGSFTVGYYGDKDSLYTKKTLEYYKYLRNVLQNMTNNKCEETEDTILYSDKVYVLTYNTRPVLEKPTPVITRFSER